MSTKRKAPHRLRRLLRRRHPARSRCFGSEGKNEEFQPADEFQLDPWIELKIGRARHEHQQGACSTSSSPARSRPGRWSTSRRRMQQTARTGSRPRSRRSTTSPTTRSRAATCRAQMSLRWFPFVATLFFFIWISNLIGYIPLPTNTTRRSNIFGLEVPSLRPLRRHRQHLGAAGPHAGRVVRLPGRGHPREGLRRATSRAGSRRHAEGHAAVPLRHRGHLAVRPDHLAVGATLREHPRRPPADPVHGRRPGRDPRHRRARLAHAAAGDRLLPLRGRPGGHAPGVHLRNAHVHLLRRGDRRRSH